MQKVVLGKWLAMKPRVMIFDEPTRGIDVGSKAEIYRLMRGLADSGVAVMMISSDMEEVIGVSDRIAVMHEGSISGVIGREQFSEENVMRLAIGRLFRVASRPARPGDAEEFFRCRGAVLDAAEALECVRSPTPQAEPFAVRRGNDRAGLSVWSNDG